MTAAKTQPAPLGDRSVCRSPRCGAVIYWVITAKGKKMPVEADGTPHWGRCPDAARFKKPKS